MVTVYHKEADSKSVRFFFYYQIYILNIHKKPFTYSSFFLYVFHYDEIVTSNFTITDNPINHTNTYFLRIQENCRRIQSPGNYWEKTVTLASMEQSVMTFQGEVSPQVPLDRTNKIFLQSHVEFHKF